ncbi:MAG: hypothetical protein P8182_07995 [Deltaproteobacteria bacterium]
MSLRHTNRLFNSHDEFAQFKNSFSGPEPAPLDSSALRERALELAELLEPKSDRSELEETLSEFAVSFDWQSFHQLSAMVGFLAKSLFKDVSRPVPPAIKRKIFEFDGPTFLFVGHASYYDYVLVGHLLHRIGMPPPIMHVTGTMCKGWLSHWLKGFRTLEIPKNLSPLRHRAYSWFCAALAECLETQALFARTSRYTVRARDGILREPYVPHGLISAVKATGRALVVPVAVSYSIIPEDRYLTASSLFSTLPVLPRHWSFFLPFLLHLRSSDKLFRGIENAFGDVSIDLGEPFELAYDDSLTLQRISHRAIEEVARNKLIHPTHIVARAMQGLDYPGVSELRQKVEEEIESIRSFFQARYHKEPPFHPVIESDLPEAVQRGIKSLSGRGALSRSVFRRRYSAGDVPLLQFYSYHGDRRIYPLSGRNSMTVVNAGVWGYTLALHIGKNLLKKEELAEHSLVLYDSREDLIERLTVEGKHPWHFKDIPLPRSVRPEADLIAAISARGQRPCHCHEGFHPRDWIAAVPDSS